jgi:hypothetical protein
MPHRSTSARPFKNRQRMKIFKNIQGLEGAVDRAGGAALSPRQSGDVIRLGLVVDRKLIWQHILRLHLRF